MRLAFNNLFLLCLFCAGGVAAVGGTISSQDHGHDLNEDDLYQDILRLFEPFKEEIRSAWTELVGVGGPLAYEKAAMARRSSQTPSTRADFITCGICRPAVPLLRSLIRSGWSKDEIEDAIIKACQLLDLAPRSDLCAPTIQSYTDSILYILENIPEEQLPMKDFCGIINDPGCEILSEPLRSWTINLTSKPPRKPFPTVPASASLITAVQFTDIHLDLDYVEGTNATCVGLPICCREDTIFNEVPEDPSILAGPFGAVGCGLPESALEAMLSHAAENHSPSFVFLTGDYVHSGVWLYNETENSKHISRVAELVAEVFPSAIVLPVVGNHEPGVVNMYTPVYLWNDTDVGSLRWVYESIAGPFENSTFLDVPEELERFKTYGFYTLAPSPAYPNLRIIVLNTNICYTNNFWLPLEPIDTNKQLQWFADILAQSEATNSEQVLILGHIQPGSGSCWSVWSNQFDRIVNRYEGIIRGMWFGHSHESYYKLTLDPDQDVATAVGFVGGSALTDGMNSAYTVYHLDGARAEESTWQVVDHETWILKLNESNAQEEAIFEKILSARQDYGLSTISPQEVHDFVLRMACDDELLRKYQEVMVKGADSPRYKGPCTERQCRVDILGDILGSNSMTPNRGQSVETYLRETRCNNGASIYNNKNTSVLMLLVLMYTIFNFY